MNPQPELRWSAFAALSLAGLFASFFPVESAAVERPFRIGIVLPGSQLAASIDGFMRGMRDQGYTEERDIAYLLHDTGSDRAKIVEATRTLLAENVNLIYTVTNTALAEVGPLAAASKTPVVFGSAAGPVESGLIPAYSTPEAHITGVTSGSIELTEKRLEVLREIFPGMKKVALFVDITAASSKAAAEVARKAAGRLGFVLSEKRVRSKEQSLQAAQKLDRSETEALFLLPGFANTSVVAELAARARQKRLPFAAYQIEHVKAGALLSYGSSYFLQGKQSARLASRILRGTPVHQLPIERPESYELILNLDTARAIGVEFSAAVMGRADAIFGRPKSRAHALPRS